MNSKGEINLPKDDFRTIKGKGIGVNISWNYREKENWGDLIEQKKQPSDQG